MTHDEIEHAKQLVEAGSIDPLGPFARTPIMRLLQDKGYGFLTAGQLASVVIDDARKVQRSEQEWRAAERRYDRLDREYETHLDGALIRRGR